MLRITTHHSPACLTFQLEGKLAGPWVQEMENCWKQARADYPQSVGRMDLRGVTFLDAAGKEFLAALHAQGAEFVAAGCAMKAVVAEITCAPLPVRDCAEEDDERRTQ
jgi:hypothetical protein